MQCANLRRPEANPVSCLIFLNVRECFIPRLQHSKYRLLIARQVPRCRLQGMTHPPTLGAIQVRGGRYRIGSDYILVVVGNLLRFRGDKQNRFSACSWIEKVAMEFVAGESRKTALDDPGTLAYLLYGVVGRRDLINRENRWQRKVHNSA
jgi:hypothetical protein